MRIHLLACVALFAFGCSSADGSGDGTTTGSTADDGGTASESASPADDGGGSDEDAATSEDSSTATADSGATKTDSGTTKTDSGSKTDSGGTTPPDAGGDPLAAARVTCVDEINKYRATLGLKPYAGWTSAEKCADGQSKSDSESGTAHGAFGKCGEFAQNECPGWPGPPDTMIKGCLKMMWAEGPGEPFSAHGHYINMSSTKYSSVACGFYQTPKGSWWAVQDFK
jgi:hypothetical protein